MKRSSFFIILALSSIATLFFLVNQGTRVELVSKDSPIKFYSNHHRQDFKLLLVNLLDHAQTSIDLAVFSLTDRDIIALLNAKAKKGVKVRIYYDDKHSLSFKRHLSEAIECTKKQKCRLMHHKIAVIDEKISLLGSTNLTKASIEYHKNLFVMLYSKELSGWLIDNMQYGAKSASFNMGQTRLTLFLMPDNKEWALKALLEELQRAKYSIKGSLFSLTHPKIIKELQAAHTRGCKVHFHLDQGQGNRKRNEFPISFSTGYELMHQKCCLIDDHLVLLGSSNWSKSGFKSNQEFFLIIDDLPAKALKEFKRCL